MEKQRRKHRTAALVGTLVLVLSLVGCGGSSDDESMSKAESWADGVCTSIRSWIDVLAQARRTLGDTGSLSADKIQSTFSDIAAATRTLVSDLKEAGTPQTEAGDQAAQELQKLWDQLDQQGQVIDDALSGSGNTPDQLLNQVSTVGGALAAMGQDVQATLKDLRGLDGAQELEDAFASAPACRDLNPSGSPSS
jgi:hypothetical protein